MSSLLGVYWERRCFQFYVIFMPFFSYQVSTLWKWKFKNRRFICLCYFRACFQFNDPFPCFNHPSLYFALKSWLSEIFSFSQINLNFLSSFSLVLFESQKTPLPSKYVLSAAISFFHGVMLLKLIASWKRWNGKETEDGKDSSTWSLNK